MSRSRKRPYYTDQSSNPKVMKRFANKKIRRFTKHLLQYCLYKRVYETWAIRDYVFFCPDDAKAYRK